MTHGSAYYEAEQRIAGARYKEATKLHLNLLKLTELPKELGTLTHLRVLDLSGNELTNLPEWLSSLTQLESLNLSGNWRSSLPDWLGTFTQLRSLILSFHSLSSLPDWLRTLSHLQSLNLNGNKLTSLPEWVGRLTQLRSLFLSYNQLTDIPLSIAQLEHLEQLSLDNNPLNLELAAAYKEGLDAVKAYLSVRTGPQVVLNEAKLILIGEGEVGKSCLLGALCGDAWEEGLPTTHGIDIKPVNVIDPDSGRDIILNGWDFGGQRVYRPTHQLFFSAPAIYLVVWKPREGSQQGFVKEWIKLVKHREPDAKILVVATHGGPGARQPDIDRAGADLTGAIMPDGSKYESATEEDATPTETLPLD